MTNKNTMVTESYFIAYKLIETLIDCSYLVAKSSSDLKVERVLDLVVSTVIQMLESDCNFKFKSYMLKKLVLFRQAPEVYKLKFVN